MDYASLARTSLALLNKNGSKALLKKTKTVVNPVTKKQTKTFALYNGVAVRSKYSAEAIGQKDGVIKAGDVKFIAIFDEEPTESVDKIIFADKTYNIESVDTIAPDGMTTIIYIIQGRKL